MMNNCFINLIQSGVLKKNASSATRAALIFEIKLNQRV
ncbi:hypothetical protein PAMC26577_17980 [Caballeronia sordidicola]|uniref:Uncharacterized protein n=1 Tax=Caballeronia sordidicola TaxID=196367 RepID=A0A242MQP3_CABSO|nr:hypothetical protein PAMC26577_17980 [Caballeronia sordidicola]